jgi:FAD/FMN-containing dehydrogenase
LGWGTCDDGIVIDATLLNGIEIDPAARTARVGGGVLTHELVSAAGQHGLACVQGECPAVGVSGLTLGGGLGWLSGKHGAACDNLLSAELVTADGRTITASAEENPDLYWAVRGGGGNFGVTTALTLRLHPIDDVVAGRLSYRFGDARAVLRGFAEIMATAPDELQAVALVRREDGEPVVHMTVVWSGNPNVADLMLLPLRSIVSPVEDTIERRPFADTFGMAAGAPPAFSAVKGSYLPRLSDESIEAVLEHFAQAPGTVPAIGFDHYTHGAVCRVAPESTAFELRAPDGLHVWIIAGWDEPSSAQHSIGWMNETWRALQAYAGGRTYANFPAAETQTADAAYGENASRLAAVKKQYDPGNVFRRNQNVQPG